MAGKRGRPRKIRENGRGNDWQLTMALWVLYKTGKRCGVLDVDINKSPPR